MEANRIATGRCAPRSLLVVHASAHATPVPVPPKTKSCVPAITRLRFAGSSNPRQRVRHASMSDAKSSAMIQVNKFHLALDQGTKLVLRCKAVEAAAGAQQSDQLRAVLDKIDEANRQDPRTVEVDGQQLPYELAYSQWLSDWTQRLTADGNPPLTEELQIVARGQHIERWKSPRSSYPDGKASYFKWREDLKKMHAARVVGFMQEAGYPQESLDKVERLILKKELKQAEGQVVEDALCLVFLERQFAEFKAKETRESMINILRRTWGKMGEKGHAAALALPLGPEEAELVAAALGGGA